MKPEIRESVKKRLRILEERRDRIVIDADTHISDPSAMGEAERASYRQEQNYYHGRPLTVGELIAEMDTAGIDMSLCWQNPSATPYSGDRDRNFDALLAANRYIFDAVQAHPDRIIPAGWTDPTALGPERALEMAELCIREFGFPVVKLNPAQNRFPIDSTDSVAVVERIASLGGTVAFHFGADTEFTPAEGLSAVAARFPQTPFIGVHMGGGGAGYLEAERLYRDARAIGLERPNIYYVLSAKRDTHIESDLISYQLAGEPYSRNLCCASDAPFGIPSWNFGGFRALFQRLMRWESHPDPRVRSHPGLFSEEVARNYLGRNFADLTIASYRNILAAA